MHCGTLGGVYTTVEGLLLKIHASLAENNPFAAGDSSTKHHSFDAELMPAAPTASSSTSGGGGGQNSRFMSFLKKLSAAARGETLPLSLVLRDPLGNSFISARLGTFTPPEMDGKIQSTVAANRTHSRMSV